MWNKLTPMGRASTVILMVLFLFLIAENVSADEKKDTCAQPDEKTVLEGKTSFTSIVNINFQNIDPVLGVAYHIMTKRIRNEEKHEDCRTHTSSEKGRSDNSL